VNQPAPAPAPALGPAPAPTPAPDSTSNSRAKPHWTTADNKGLIRAVDIYNDPAKVTREEWVAIGETSARPNSSAPSDTESSSTSNATLELSPPFL